VSQLARAHDSYNALATVAARNIPKYLKRDFSVPIAVGVSALGGVAEAYFGTKGLVGLAVLSALSYGVGMMSSENADLREAAYTIATGLGSSASAIAANDAAAKHFATPKAAAAAA